MGSTTWSEIWQNARRIYSLAFAMDYGVSKSSSPRACTGLVIGSLAMDYGVSKRDGTS
jgi:hypothetical protein